MAASKKAAPARPGGPAGGGRSGKALRKPELIRALREELAAVRASLKETLENYQGRVEGSLAPLAAMLQENGEGGAHARPPRARVLQAMLARAQRLDVKPQRGRLRDLARIQELAEDLWALMPAED